MKLLVAGQTVALLLAGVTAVGGQEVQQVVAFPEASVPIIAETTSPGTFSLPDLKTATADEPSFWKSVGIGAGLGALAAGTAGYVLYPNVVDPWFGRWEWTGVTAAQGAVAGAAVGAVVALVRRTL